MKPIVADELTGILDLLSRNVDRLFNLSHTEAIDQRNFKEAHPFPHFVIENFLCPDVAEQIKQCVLADSHKFDVVFNDGVQRNKTISTGAEVPLYLQLLAGKLASPHMLRYLEKLTGLKNLISDPYFNTDVGYYHIMGSGGVLGSHVDHSHHGTLNIPHVLNLVLYISPDWMEEYGGRLLLYDRSGKTPVVGIVPVFNRAVIFMNNPVAYHGVDPLSNHARKSRHSLYFAYYCITGSGNHSTKSFPLSYLGAANEVDDTMIYGTHFLVPFKDLFRRDNRAHLLGRISHLLHMVLPPVLVGFAKKFWRRNS